MTKDELIEQKTEDIYKQYQKLFLKKYKDKTITKSENKDLTIITSELITRGRINK